MLCVACKKLPKTLTEPASRRAWGLPGWERLRHVICSRCGALLPLHDPTDSMLRTMTRLARVGLAAEADPILGA